MPFEKVSNMSKKPLILVTNDDGINSPGLAAAVRGAMQVGDIVIAAPNKQQTAMGRAYPMRDDLGVIDVVRIDVGIGAKVEAFAVHGSPGYAAAYGIAEIAPKIKGRKPDIPALDFHNAELATEYWLRYILEKGMPKEADILNVNVPEAEVGPEDYIFTFLETHPYYKAQPVPQRDWGKPYRIRFDSEFGDKDAQEGSDIHTLHFKRKTSVTPLTIDMTKR